MHRVFLEELLETHKEEGMCPREHRIHVAQCIEASVTQDGDWIIEIGSYYGNTTTFMARILKSLPTKNHHIVTIDCYGRSVDLYYNGIGCYGRLIDMLAKFDVLDMVIPITGYSQQVAQYLRGGCSFVSIDGSHRYEDVKQDIIQYNALLKEGGLIWIDDLKPPYEGPRKAMNECLDEIQGLELLHRYEGDAILKKYG